MMLGRSSRQHSTHCCMSVAVAPLLNWAHHGVVTMVVALMLSTSSVRGEAVSDFKWPDEGMGQRTPERVSAGKRAAKYIACNVCEERVLALIPPGGDLDMISPVVENNLGDWIGDTKGLCEMRGLANLFRNRRLEVKTKPDGSAVLATVQSSSKIPFYEEINTSELAFHWKSFAVQHACAETFRRDGDAITRGFEKAYAKITGEHGATAEDIMRELLLAARKACGQAKMCKAATKLMGERTNGGEL